MARPLTLAEKLLAAHAGAEELRPGQLVECDIDLVMGNDVTAPIAISVFEQMGCGKVFDAGKVALVADHYTPNKDIMSAEQARIVREFAHKQGIRHYWELGRGGVEHALLPEQGVVVAGDLVIGADSHTCTYGALGAFATGVGSTDAAVAFATGRVWFKVPESVKVIVDGTLAPGVTAKDLILHIIGSIGVDGVLYQALEFYGSAIRDLSMAGRMTLCNMAVEAGAKTGIIEVDAVTRAYLAGRAQHEWIEYHADKDATYARTLVFDALGVEPCVACPSLPSNVRPARELVDVIIDQAVIGSCTNGRIEDLRQAAQVLRGKSTHPKVRCIVIPATQEVYRQCLNEGLIDVFLDAGCVFSTPTCGPCLGGHMGVLAAGERAVATTNRNFVGRMGDPASEVYLASPLVTAASAIAGHIAVPEECEG